MLANEQALLSWDLEFPEKQGNTFVGSKKPQATLVLETEDGDERISLPSQVARKMASNRKAGEFEPQTREGLLAGLDDATVYCARMRIERLMNRREYASAEVRDKLREDGYRADVIDSCIRRAIEVGLVSDDRFADSFIRSKVFAGWGMTRIERELKRRGIDTEDVSGWPYEYLDPEDELGRAVEIASHRRVSGKNQYEKLVRHLVSRGFTPGVSYRAARQVLDEQ